MKLQLAVTLSTLALALSSCQEKGPKDAADAALAKTSSAVQAMSSASTQLLQNLSASGEEGCKMDTPCEGNSSASNH